MKKLIFFLLLLVLLVLLVLLAIVAYEWGKNSPQKKQYYTTRELFDYGKPNNLNWVTVEKIEQAFKNTPPMAIGFDIDDTVIYSGAVMRAIRLLHPDIKDDKTIPGRYETINCELVSYQQPKASLQKLIDMHQKRGDTLYFITARKSADCVERNAYSLKEHLQEAFGIRDMKAIIYAGPSSKGVNAKTAYIKDLGIKIYYGDDDQDIEAAQEANSLGVRILRPSISQKKSGNRIGFYKEWVLEQSFY